MYMIGDEVVHNGQTYVSLINYNECALDNYLAWRIKKEERNCGAKIRLIDVDALYKNYQEICSDIACIGCPFLNEDGCEVEQMIRYAPILEVDPIKHGKWIKVNDDDSLFRCSVCGELSCCASKYCGDCGAKMENEKCVYAEDNCSFKEVYDYHKSISNFTYKGGTLNHE